MLQWGMNGRFDDAKKLGINHSPPRALGFRDIVSFGSEVGSVVLPIKPKFDGRSPCIIFAPIQLVSGETSTNIVGANWGLKLQSILGHSSGPRSNHGSDHKHRKWSNVKGCVQNVTGWGRGGLSWKEDRKMRQRRRWLGNWSDVPSCAEKMDDGLIAPVALGGFRNSMTKGVGRSEGSKHDGVVSQWRRHLEHHRSGEQQREGERKWVDSGTGRREWHRRVVGCKIEAAEKMTW